MILEGNGSRNTWLSAAIDTGFLVDAGGYLTALARYIDQIDLAFIEREATPRFLMKLGIQLHLALLSLSNTVSILDIFGVKRARSTVHNWVHEADLQPQDGQRPDHVAVDETVIRLNDEQYWLYTAVDPETNRITLYKA